MHICLETYRNLFNQHRNNPSREHRIVFILTFVFYFVQVQGVSAQVNSPLDQTAILYASQKTPRSEGNTSNLKDVNSMNKNGLCFTPNKGQLADINGKSRPDILYKGDGGGSNIYLRETGLSYVFSNMTEIMQDVEEQSEQLEKESDITEDVIHNKKQELIQKQILKIHRVDMDFVNCLSSAPSTGAVDKIEEDKVEGYTNYYYAHCPQGVLGVTQFNKITYKNIYNSIDVSYYGYKGDDLKYDIIINPGGDPDQIKLLWNGAESVFINNEGNLVIKTSVNEFIESVPKVYQNINGRIIDINAKYVLNGTIVGFELEKWDPSYPLIIDPWVSYFGGSNWEVGGSVTTDLSGNVAFAGLTFSIDFPVSVGAFQAAIGGGGVGVFDVFVVEMTSAGSLLWATFLGGSASEGNNNSGTGPGIAADNFGNILVAGTTQSNNFPVGASPGNVVHQNTSVGNNAFIFKFSPIGARLWGTYYGGTSGASGYDVATDGSNVFLYGNTYSGTGISTAGAFQVALNGTGPDVFVAKFASNGNRIWGTYIGGSSTETWGNGGITYDPVTTSVYLSGITYSANFPISPGCHQPVHGGGLYDAFLFKLSSAGTTRLWATFYGGTGQEYYSCINTTDGLGNVILSGVTNSLSGISSGGAYQVSNGGGIDTYLAKFNSSGVRQWSTYFGGNVNEFVWGIATDSNNNIYIAGDFEDGGRGNYPISSCAYQTIYGGGPVNENEDQFIAKYDPGGKQRCITYMGGSLEDDADNFANTITIYGNVLYLTGYTRGNYPVTAGAYQTMFSGVYDAFIAQLCINLCEAKVPGLSYSASTTNVCVNTPVTFTPSVSNSCDTSGYKFLWTFTGGTPASSTAVNPIVAFSGVGTHDVKLVLTTVCKKDSITKISYITVNPCGGITASVNSATICSGATPCPTITASGSSGTSPYTYSWSTGNTTQSISPCPTSTTTYTVQVTDSGGATSTTTATVTVNATVSVTVSSTNLSCNGSTNGTATANPGSGTSPFTYNWSNAGTTQTITGLTQGNYTVTVTDNKGCTFSTSVALISPAPLAGQFSKGTANCTACGCKEWLMVAATGGTSPYAYSWPDGYTNRYKNKICPGSYTVNIKDKNGCSVIVSLTAP